MMGLAGFSFAVPWALLGLLALPVLWWLLRLMPPAPKRQIFPAIRLLFGLRPPEETPYRTPWWLLLLRLVIASLVILALAHPLEDARQPLPGGGPLLLVVDNGWAAAAHWNERQATLADRLRQAEREGRMAALLATAPGADGAKPQIQGPMPAAEARQALGRLEPQPWPTDRKAALAALGAAPFSEAAVYWASDGIADPDGADQRLGERLAQLGSLTVIAAPPSERALLQRPPENDSEAMTLHILRPAAGPGRPFEILATDRQGQLVARQTANFKDGDTQADPAIKLPVELRNRIATLTVANEASAGATFLVDAQWRRRPVGLVAGADTGREETLLSELYYLRRALGPGTELREGTIQSLVQGGLSMLVMVDIGTLTAEETAALKGWVDKGGLLLRFAGPRLAENAEDSLLPVHLRSGGRTLGGALTWEQPAQIAPFAPTSPFAGLPVPDDVRIFRQVLAEPELSLGEKTWARLTDGTPLVTAERSGRGWLVLVHTTANADWSNLALSGLFVEMLQKILALSEGVAGGEAEGALPPYRTLDGFGRLGAPAALATAAGPEVFDKGLIGPDHPPGFYGNEATQRALNLGTNALGWQAIQSWPSGATIEGATVSVTRDFKPWLLAAALALFFVDLMISLALRGLLPGRAPVAGALLLLALAGGFASAAQAKDDDDSALNDTRQTRLAYVRSGDDEIDKASQAGLMGLALVLRQRTAIDVGEPVAVDPAQDELAFFPLIYWPISNNGIAMSDQALRRVNDYLKNGGLILFDTRDGGASGFASFNRVARGIDITRLIQVPQDHVLTKAFYLLQQFPGRWASGTVWVEEGQGRANDGVSSVVVGSNDWAAAWAVDESGQPLYATVPGGQRQREFAYRFGVNLVMYALTGNYKSDQVHVPAILERLGQ
ncbi:MAG TPA: DUF4159 domain-containing protein [Hypericibacter adhaerens]|uniref:DUF4159 domain-containing protein n=1 Tax=Hypericibacter adhaerens TaxID=2602016 RepID=UPI002C3361F7|nr:DUF4159 domain-containing protein [Hypericibacter adhaerens]HWA45294.1 DUF4159 domain-containing protein [Hypericibacter adhaerens]